MKISVSKLDAARRQLESSIALFFQDGEPVSMYALTRAAHEVLETICKKQGMNSIIIDGIEKYVKEEKKDYVFKKINEFKNFIKHADRDPDAVVEFDSEVTQYFIWDACRLYKLLANDYTMNMLVFTTWISLMYPDIFVNPGNIAPFLEAKSLFDPMNKIKFYSDVSRGYTLIMGKLK